MAEQGVDRFDPKDMTCKYGAEVPRERFGDRVQIKQMTQLLLHRRHRLRSDTTGNDQVEIIQVRVYVERESVRSDEAGDVDADGCEFSLGRFLIRPNTGQSWTPFRRDREIGTGTDQDFFESANEFDSAESFAFAIRRGESSKVEDRVADDLSRTVESNITAAITFEKINAAMGQEFGRCNDVASFRIAPKSNDRGVF